ncbi:hypothetical protein EDD21DRAFT_306951 [Dissophora ornata]|nr:hypothetical protein EDD21DRAFT_306951 [Dissophora ornata]
MGNAATVTWQTVLSQKRTPHNLPRFFSYLNSSSCTVAGSSIPRNEIDVDALEQAGFRLVITLIKEYPLSATWFHHHDQKGENTTPKKIRNAFVPIENRKAPGFPEVFDILMGWCSRYPHQRATLIHCGGGKGRAGIVLAAHLIRFGLRNECLNRYQAMMTAKDAMAHLRELRPGSIESVEQEKAVKAYGDWLWKRGGGKQPKERPSYQVSGSPLVSAPKLVILVGLPGSGKSHLTTSLLQEYPEHFVRISQDELGSRSVCERLLAQSMRHQQTSIAARGPKKALPMTIFVDRCNPTISERKEWYEVAFQPDEAIMVWFSKGVEQCIERVDSREGHPTVAPGMGSKVALQFASPTGYRPASLGQGTDRIAGDRDSAGAEASTLPSVGRSTAISRSDLLLPPTALHRVFSPKPHQVLTVEEKMDGANIGFSVLHFKTMEGVQNRNHFVHPDDHWQFKKLSGWLERHREDILWLYKVLQDGLAPYVLYGEWMYAKHSVQYTGLRSWFVPFDLFDIKTGTFVSRALFRKAMAQTQLTPNPIIQSRSALMRGSSEVETTTDCPTDKPPLQQKDRVEGLYFRIDQGDRLLMRSKVVRPDFIAGEERWGTKEQVANQLVFYEETLPDYDNEEHKD